VLEYDKAEQVCGTFELQTLSMHKDLAQVMLATMTDVATYKVGSFQAHTLIQIYTNTDYCPIAIYFASKH
jgi:hypothetical protein